LVVRVNQAAARRGAARPLTASSLDLLLEIVAAVFGP
jgi:hypothetical protein